MFVSRAGARNLCDDPGASCGPKARKCLKKDGDMLKDTEAYLKQLPMATAGTI